MGCGHGARYQPDLTQHRPAALHCFGRQRQGGAVAVGPPDRGQHISHGRPQRHDLARELDLGRSPHQVDVEPRTELGEKLAGSRVGGRVERDDMVEAGGDAVGIGGSILGELDPA